MSLLTLVVTLLLAGPALGADEPFADLDFDAAAAKAKDAGKLLLVDFTATWCPPCKMMEKQTWPDEKVQAWVHEHAVAIQVDIDEHQDLAQRFSVRAIPTVVFLRDGAEQDRHTGFRAPGELVEWGDGVLAGRSETHEAAAEAKDLLQSDDIDKRYDAARDALHRGDYDVALQHYLWLWPNTRRKPSFGGVRLSFMVSDMARLAKGHEPARVAFRHLLDEAQVKVEDHDDPSLLDWMEWSALCREFSADSRIVTWYESIRDEQGRLFASAPPTPTQSQILGDIFKILVEAERPVDAVRLYQDVRAASQRQVQQFRLMKGMGGWMPEENRQEIRKIYEEHLRKDLSSLYGAALADGREEEAAGVAGDLLSALDDVDSRLALVARALDLATARPAQLGTWLDEAAAKGADVADLRARMAAPGAEAR